MNKQGIVNELTIFRAFINLQILPSHKLKYYEVKLSFKKIKCINEKGSPVFKEKHQVDN